MPVPGDAGCLNAGSQVAGPAATCCVAALQESELCPLQVLPLQGSAVNKTHQLQDISAISSMSPVIRGSLCSKHCCKCWHDVPTGVCAVENSTPHALLQTLSVVLHAAGRAGTLPVEHAGILVLEVHPAAEVWGHCDLAPATFLLQHFLQRCRGLYALSAVMPGVSVANNATLCNMQAVYSWSCGIRLARPTGSVPSAMHDNTLCCGSG